jgi:hypothetical protein
MSKHVFFVGIATVAVALAFVLTDSVLTTLTAGVTEANVRRIREGMTKPQVERILGWGGKSALDWVPDPTHLTKVEWRVWKSEAGEIIVGFHNGHVEFCFWLPRSLGLDRFNPNWVPKPDLRP